MAPPRLALLLCVTCLLVASAEPQEDQEISEDCDPDDGSCRANGSAMLQVRSANMSRHVVEEEPPVGETVVPEELEAAAKEGMAVVEPKVEVSLAEGEEEVVFASGEESRTEVFEGATLLVHRDAIRVDGGRRYRWVVNLPEGCTDAQLKSFTQKMPPGTKSGFGGDPDRGGICFFIMTATLKEAKKEILTHKWPSKPTLETDKEWSAIPEIGGDSLLEEDEQWWWWGRRRSTPAPAPPPPPPATPHCHRHHAGEAPRSWGLDRVDGRSGQDSSFSPRGHGAGVHVYVADTGIRTTHQDFCGRAVPTLEVLGDGPVVCKASNTSCAEDRQGHGTHCAATVGGERYGVARKATLHAVKILSDTGRGSLSWFIEMLDWILTNGEKPSIVSASLGGKGVYMSVSASILRAANSGITVVVAAGNENDDACGYAPAFAPHAITVGSTQRGDRRSGFSNYGACVNIFAPGSSIKSASEVSDSKVATMSGTSMACPHVAGGVAILLEKNPKATFEQLKDLLLQATTSGKVSDKKSGSPNKLLYVGK